jgi:hypothetical protein
VPERTPRVAELAKRKKKQKEDAGDIALGYAGSA